MVTISFLLACALHVAPLTTVAVVDVESGGNELAIHVNGDVRRFQPANVSEAVTIAQAAIRAGHTVDLGLMQVNSRNLAALGYQVEDMFVPCANLRAGSTILLADYQAAAKTYGPGQRALRAALSAYNSGDFERGYRNGYVAKFLESGAGRRATRAARTASGNQDIAEGGRYARN